MSAVGHSHDATQSGRLKWIGASFAVGMTRLARPSRRPLPHIDWNTFLIRTAVACVALFFVMLLMDVPTIVGARRLPAWLVDIFNELTDFGKSGYFLWPLGVVIIAIAAISAPLPRMARAVLAAIALRAGFLFLAISLPSLAVTIVKRIIGRARPFVGGSADAFLYQPFSWKVAYASLPSGHAVTAFAAAAAISMLWPRLRYFIWTYAAFIAVSRVVVTAHHPSDVLAGAFVGIIGAVLVRNYFASRRLVFGVSGQGTVGLFPGPSLRRTKSVARALLAD